MENELTKQIAERMAGLPGDVRQAILSAEIGRKVQEIGKKHSLHIDQTAVLEDATLLVILGLIELTDFVKQLGVQLRVPADQAEKISADINQQVLLSIRESMKRGTREKEPEIKAASPAPMPQQSSPTQSSVPPPQVKPPTMAQADLTLTQKTVTAILPPAPPTKVGPPSTPNPSQKKEQQKPDAYKADPYREPVE